MAAAFAAFALVLPAGCSNDGSGEPAAVAAPVARDFASYDVFVSGTADNNPLFADIYGIRFSPFSIDRITTNKRISSLDADETRIVVAAADENIDQLAQVTETGEMEPIPGLGRPHAYSPRVLDGIMYFDDAQGDDKKGENRYFAWDLTKRNKRLLFQTNVEYGGATPIGGGRLLLRKPSTDNEAEVFVRSEAGKLTSFPLDRGGLRGALGQDWLVSTLYDEDSSFGDSPTGMALVDLDTGQKKQIPGLQPIAWNPDGTRLLARHTDVLTDSSLVILDPAKPDAPVDLQTVPGLAIYGGVWVRGNAPA